MVLVRKFLVKKDERALLFRKGDFVDVLHAGEHKFVDPLRRLSIEVFPLAKILFDHRLAEFKQRGVEVIGCSIDSQFTHLAWKNTAVNAGGIGQVGYPLVADIKHEICRAYDVEAGGGVAFRGSFLIDRAGVVRHQVVNDLPLGRNVDEMLRMVDALQFTEEHGEVCPAGWNKGKAGMKASPDGVAKYLAEHAKEL